MRTTPYIAFPSIKTWKKDSKIPDITVRRRSDRVLKSIDTLVKDINEPDVGGERTYLLCELYFATNYWIGNFKANPTMNNKREAPIRLLKDCSEKELASAFDCGPLMVRPKLQQYYGKSITSHGVFTDSGQSYLPAAERQKFKLVFKNGAAYWVEWFNKDSKRPGRLVKVNTKEAFNKTPSPKKDVLEYDWGFFVLSNDRDIFVGNHEGSGAFWRVAPIFHSSYMRGVSVQFAGSIHIEEGVVKAIRNDSGHYHPNDKFFINILSHLKTVGVKLKDIELYSYEGNRIKDQNDEDYPADRYLKENGRWELVEKRRQQYLLARRTLATDIGREKIFLRIYEGSQNIRYAENYGEEEILRKLNSLAEEQYNLLLEKGNKPSFNLWRETWEGICLAISEFISDPKMGNEKKLWQDRAKKPSRPPMAKVETRKAVGG